MCPRFGRRSWILIPGSGELISAGQPSSPRGLPGEATPGPSARCRPEVFLSNVHEFLVDFYHLLLTVITENSVLWSWWKLNDAAFDLSNGPVFDEVSHALVLVLVN